MGEVRGWRLAAVVVAVAFLAGATGFWLNRDRPAGEGSASVGFLRDMSVHHEQAVDLALLALRPSAGVDGRVQLFAQEVLLSQRWELGRMYELQRDLGHPYQGVAPGSEVMGWMGEPTTLEAMPGWVPEDRFAALRSASGRGADQLFLELMAAHHAGAVHMASAAAEDAGHPVVRRMAATIAEVQRTEIAELRAAAEALGLPTAPYEALLGGEVGGDHAEH